MTKQRRINFQKVSSVLVILFGVVMVLAAFLEFGGFTIMRMAVNDVELGARQISELLATMGVFSLVLAVASIVAGIMGFRNAALGKEKLVMEKTRLYPSTVGCSGIQRIGTVIMPSWLFSEVEIIHKKGSITNAASSVMAR